MASRKRHGPTQTGDEEQPSTKYTREQMFISKYSLEWPCLLASKRGKHFAYCQHCQTDLSIAHGGRDDCRRHILSKKHVSYAALAKDATSSNMKKYFGTKADATATAVTRAEVGFLDLCLELNLPLTAMDKITSVCKAVFKDSEIAKGFSCGRSKSTAMMHELARETKTELLDNMRKRPFTISTDGSNDTGEKLYPMVIRSLDPLCHQVRSDALSVPCCNGPGTGENIFNLIKEIFDEEGIPWGNCLALGSDNANVMVGKKNGVFGRMQREHPSLYSAGCVCHLVHIAAEKAAKVLPVNIDEVLVDVFYYLEKSSNRQADLRAMQVLHEVKESKMLKHVCTRWLSVTRCLTRMLDNWEPLLQFFREESKSSKKTERVERLKDFFQSPTNRLYCLFLKHVLAVFDKFNTELQSAEPKIHVLRRRLHSLLRDIMVMFVKPSAMLYKSVLEVQFELGYNIKSNDDLLLGEEARLFLSNKADNNLRDKRISQFFDDVKNLFKTACKYILNKLPVSCELLKHIEVVDVSKQTESHWSSLQYLIAKFPCLIGDSSEDTLATEFACYQITDLRSCLRPRIDDTWAEISKLEDENGSVKFTALPETMLSLLTIPHSSAHCERIFSLVRKNHTVFRPNLGPKSLEAIVVAKSRPSPVGERQYTTDQLQNLKRCYARSLKS